MSCDDCSGGEGCCCENNVVGFYCEDHRGVRNLLAVMDAVGAVVDAMTDPEGPDDFNFLLQKGGNDMAASYLVERMDAAGWQIARKA